MPDDDFRLLDLVMEATKMARDAHKLLQGHARHIEVLEKASERNYQRILVLEKRVDDLLARVIALENDH